MLVLLLLLVTYAVLVYPRNYISLAGRLGIVIGGAGGFLLGVLILGAAQVHFPLLPVFLAVTCGLFAGARFHRMFRDSFKD